MEPVGSLEVVSQIKPGIRQLTLRGIGQGCSGASVFRLHYREAAGGTLSRKRVLKLTPDQDRAKCEHELRSYGEISKELGDDIFSLVPKIEAAHGSALVPAEYEGWLGVIYTYLRSKRFALFDLADIYLRPEQCLAEATKAGAVLSSTPLATDLAEHFLNSLSEHLAGWDRSSHSIHKTTVLWVHEKPTNERWQPPQLPPYGFALREKWRIIEALQSVAPYGASLRRCRWRQTSGKVLSCVSPGSRPPRVLRVLTSPQPTLLAHVHGDMNANNVFLALGCNVPFLIDFACYQSQGHVLQDFARLEVALKLELMGREEGTAPPGKDLNSASFDSVVRGGGLVS